MIGEAGVGVQSTGGDPEYDLRVVVVVVLDAWVVAGVEEDEEGEETADD